MIRVILAALLVVLLGSALGLPQGSRPVMAAGFGADVHGVVPRIVEYARASGTPVGPQAPGGMYCFAPVNAKGEVDFSQAKAYGSVTRAVQLHEVRLKADGKRTKGAVVTGVNADANTGVFFARPVTAEEFCGLAQTQFVTKRDYAWNLF